MTWLSARSAFTFKGTSYTAGQVFQVDPLVAVQMRAARLVTYAKKPEASRSADPPAAPRLRKRYTTKHMEPEPEPPLTPATAPAEETVTLVNHNLDDGKTYTRKDLRAED